MPLTTRLLNKRTSSAALVFALLVLVVLFFQVRNNAFLAELTDDDSSHYLSGLMIHDYLRSGLRMSPVAYLSMYHAHYPIIGIGHWGPAFYVLEAIWMLLVSPSIPSAILLSTIIAASTAFLTYLFGTRRLQLDPVFALTAALLFVATPLIQAGSATIMLDIPIACLVMVAAFLYAAYVQTEAPLYSALFGLTATAAILTKGNGALLALLPPLVVLATGKWSLLKRASFWLPALIVGVLAGPWYLLTYGQVAAGFRYKWGLDYSTMATRENAQIVLGDLGLPLLALLVLGVAAALSKDASPRSLAARTLLATLLAVWIFQTVAPAAIQDRYLAPLIPPALLLATFGLQALVNRLGQGRCPLELKAAAAGLVILLALPAALGASPRQSVGLRQIAKLVWSMEPPSNRVVLIAASAKLEGAAIAELATADPHRPSLFAVRGSRLLGGGGYNNADYVPKFDHAAQVGAELERMRVPLVLYKADAGGWRHISQIDEVRATARPAWRLLGLSGAAGDPIQLYALPEALGKPADVGLWLATAAPQHLQGSVQLAANVQNH
jgi:hypothetical protein